MHVVVYGRWDHGSPVPQEVQARVARAFRPADETVCAWVDPENPHHLTVSFDVHAASLDEAIDVGRAELTAAATRVPLSGHLTEVVSMTDEEYCTWSA